MEGPLKEGRVHFGICVITSSESRKLTQREEEAGAGHRLDQQMIIAAGRNEPGQYGRDA
jgi:hypothetical protein